MSVKFIIFYLMCSRISWFRSIHNLESTPEGKIVAHVEKIVKGLHYLESVERVLKYRITKLSVNILISKSAGASYKYSLAITVRIF